MPSNSQWLRVERERSKLIPKLQFIYMKALLEQVDPLLTKAQQLQYIDESLANFISEEPMKLAWTKAYELAAVAAGIESITRVERLKQEEGITAAIQQWLKVNVADKITAVTETTRRLVKNIIIEQVSAGTADIPRIMRGIREQWIGVSRRRATTIARTEVIPAYNIGSMVGAMEVSANIGVPVKKIWLATTDQRVRDAHFAANGQIRAMEQDFVVGGERLSFPGDPRGSAANVIMCRCAMGYQID